MKTETLQAILAIKCSLKSNGLNASTYSFDTKILEQIGKKRFTGKIRNSYFNELKEQLDIKRRKT